MIINSLTVEDGEVTVGATDLARWEFDGGPLHGANARTSVWVTIKDNGPGMVASETVGLLCPPGDPQRADSVRAIPALLDVAQSIRARGISEDEAAAEFFGRAVYAALARDAETVRRVPRPPEPPPEPRTPTDPAFAISDLRRLRVPDLRLRVPDLHRHLARAVPDDEPVAVSTWWELPTTSTHDRWWSLRLFDGGHLIGVRASCLAARRVLPDSPRDRLLCLAAIEAAEAWAESPTEGRRLGVAAAQSNLYFAIFAGEHGFWSCTAADDAARAVAFDGWADAVLRAADAASRVDYVGRVDEREAQSADLGRLLADLRKRA